MAVGWFICDMDAGTFAKPKTGIDVAHCIFWCKSHKELSKQATGVRGLLERCWTPPGVTLPESGLTPEVVGRLVRMTGGNLRLLTRLLTQVERVLGVNDAQVTSVEIVEAARDSVTLHSIPGITLVCFQSFSGI